MSINIEQRIDHVISVLCNASGELRLCQRDLLELRHVPVSERVTSRLLLSLCRLNRQKQRIATAALHGMYGFGGGV